MKKLLLLTLSLLSGCHPVPACQLTDAIAHVESDFGLNQGERGWHQMSRAAWFDTTCDRVHNGLPESDYRERFDYATSTVYCEDYIALLNYNFERQCHKPPTLDQTLAMYHCGFTGLSRHGFDASFDKSYAAKVKGHLPCAARKPLSALEEIILIVVVVVATLTLIFGLTYAEVGRH